MFDVTGGIGTSDPSRITYRGQWLHNMIVEAFGVRGDQITGPEWLSKERYDIVAIIPEGATKEQFNIMLGNLLRDRFHLRFHIESKTRPVYALRVAKSGIKFKETSPRADDGSGFGTDAQGFPVLPPGRRGMFARPTPGEIFRTAQEVAMPEFAQSLESSAGRPVIDETGLTGHYDFKIHYEWMRRPGDAGFVADPAPTVFTALEEQLGLKLESATSSFTQFIIDSIDREPVDN